MKGNIPESAGWNWRWVLWLVLGFALLIRLWGTWYGLPFSYYADEYHEVMRALELGTGSFNFQRTGKGGFYFLLFIEYGLYFVFLKLAGVVATAEDFAKLFVRDPSAFYLMGRITAAIIGSITIVAVFYLGRLAYATAAGLLGALFVAVNVLHIDLSRLIGVDVPMTMLVTVALYFGLRIVATGRRSDYLLAALVAGLATTTKLPGMLLLLPLLVAHTYAVANAAGGLRGWFGTRDLWLAVAVFVGVLFATNPSIAVGFTGYFSYFASPSIEVTDAAAVGAIADLSGYVRPNLYIYYLSGLQASMGWPLLLLGLTSLAYALWKRTPADVMLLSYALVNYFVMASTTANTAYYPRYALPIIVVLAVFTGRGLADLMQVISRARVIAIAAIVTGCVAIPIGESIATAYSLRETDIRTQTKQWFEANIPVGSRVLIEGAKIGPDRETVPLRDTADALRRRIKYWEVTEPKQAKFLEYRLAVQEGGGYDLELVRLDTVGTLDEYAAQGIKYFVVRPKAFMESRKAGAGARRLLNDLRSDPRVRLIKRFEGTDKERVASAIEIYQLLSNRDKQGSVGKLKGSIGGGIQDDTGDAPR